VVDRAAICVLAHATGPATLERISADSVRASLAMDLASVHDLYGNAPDHVLSRICAQGGWRLGLTRNPPDALHLLQALIEEDTTGA
jgi:hypothetical protein